MSERKAGWHWVKVADKWEAAHWTGAEWEIVGTDSSVSDDVMYKIGSRIPTPDEPWQCVPVEPTDEMVNAASKALDGSIGGYEANRAMRAYQANLLNAPKPEDV